MFEHRLESLTVDLSDYQKRVVGNTVARARLKSFDIDVVHLKYLQMVARIPCSSGAITSTIDRLPAPWTVTTTGWRGRRMGEGAEPVATMLRRRSPSASQAALSN